jgi:hypothetical protein
VCSLSALTRPAVETDLRCVLCELHCIHSTVTLGSLTKSVRLLVTQPLTARPNTDWCCACAQSYRFSQCRGIAIRAHDHTCFTLTNVFGVSLALSYYAYLRYSMEVSLARSLLDTTNEH